jgi:hypothetical protein
LQPAGRRSSKFDPADFSLKKIPLKESYLPYAEGSVRACSFKIW